MPQKKRQQADHGPIDLVGCDHDVIDGIEMVTQWDIPTDWMCAYLKTA